MKIMPISSDNRVMRWISRDVLRANLGVLRAKSEKFEILGYSWIRYIVER